MAITAAYKREFVRKIFRDAGDTPTNEELISVLDGLSDTAMATANGSRGSGKVLIGSSSPEGSASWQVLSSMKGLNEQIELIDAARALIGDGDDLDTILASVVSINRYGCNFSNARAFN